MLVGFGSARGSVIAGEEWEAPMKRMKVPPGRPGSWEDVLHRAGEEDRLLLLGEARTNEQCLRERGHLRAAADGGVPAGGPRELRLRRRHLPEPVRREHGRDEPSVGWRV